MRALAGNVSRRLIVAGVVVAALVAVYYLVDPMQSRWLPKCVFYVLTGWECPGCGSQRMVHALAHGDLAAAWNANPFLVCLIPLLALMAYASIFREKSPRLYSAVNSVPVIVTIGVALVLWAVLRNVF